MKTKEERMAKFIATSEANKINFDLHKSLIEKYIVPKSELEKASIEYFLKNGKPTGGFLLMLMAYAEAYHEDKTRWIDTDKEKPEFDMHVLVNCKIYGRYIASYVFIGEFQGEKYGNWHDGKQLGVLPPTHWQPLPSPPKP